MIENRFAIASTVPITEDASWSELSREQRLAYMQRADAPIDDAIRQRLGAFKIDYLPAVRTWTVRTDSPTSVEDVRRLLTDLQVEVAPDMTFNAWRAD